MALPPYRRGITRGALATAPAGMRLSVHSVRVPVESRAAVAALVSGWEFKRRAGFETPQEPPAVGLETELAKHLLGIRFAEPVRVVWADESGFGYETRPGHPIYGEESFRIDHEGLFTARSVSRPSTLTWWMLSPALRLLQWWTHRQYTRIVLDAVRRQYPPRIDE
ncbi:DUF1990 family protein [Microbacterium sp. NPDC055903]